MADQNNKSYSIELAEITARLFSNCNEKEIRHAKQYGVSIGEFRCLRSLYHKKDPTVNQLAQELSITSSRVTRIVDGLVAKKLVRRITPETDRRIFNLSLTPKGEKLAAELVLKHIKIHEEIISQIPEDVHQLMIEMLGQLNRAVEDWLKK
ncbi:MAG: MarR family transcriptional regulator [bacterium]|nr:MarR family transcriptional regulator [bacterium]